jgi:hypothetical protein
MKTALVLATALLLAACDKPAEKPAAAAAPPPPPAATPINLADVAGTWEMKTMPEVGDSVLLVYTIKASGADTGWTITFAGRKPMPMTVMVMGDSIMTDVAPYESMLRKGVKVSTHGIMHIKDGQMVGTTIAHYSKGPDTVRTLRTVGTKKP